MLVKLGYALRSHGLSGNVIFSLLDTRRNVLQEGKEVFLFPMKGSELPREGLNQSIRHLNLKGGLMAFLSIHNKEELGRFLPFSIFMDRKLFPPLPEGEFYISDLVGLPVLKNGSEEKVGVVKDYYHVKEQVVLQIEGERTYELPLIKEFFPVILQDRLEMIIPEFV